MATTIERTQDKQDANKTLKLEMSRVIRASRQRVFDAWTRPEYIRQWFAPGNMTVPNAATDPRAGGAYRIEMQGSDATCEGNAEAGDMSRIAVVTGTYKKIVPYELLSFTWKWDGSPDAETLVTVAFRDIEGGTEVTLTHEHFTSEESMGKHQHGWMACLDKLEKFAPAH